MIDDAIDFASLNAQPCSQSYETKHLVQEKDCYEFRILDKSQIKAIGVMSIVVADTNDKNKTTIFIQKLSEYKSVFYKCSEQKKRLHFGVLLENDFVISRGKHQQMKFTHCLLHSFVTSSDHKKTVVNLQFKNNSDFHNELADVLVSKKGICLSNSNQLADQRASAYALVDFIQAAVERPFQITGKYNCSHFQACLNFLLRGDLDFNSNYEAKYSQFINELPDHIKQLKN